MFLIRFWQGTPTLTLTSTNFHTSKLIHYCEEGRIRRFFPYTVLRQESQNVALLASYKPGRRALCRLIPASILTRYIPGSCFRFWLGLTVSKVIISRVSGAFARRKISVNFTRRDNGRAEIGSNYNVFRLWEEEGKRERKTGRGRNRQRGKEGMALSELAPAG